LPAEAAPAWLWLPELPNPGSERVLGGDDAHYVSRVCRAEPGDRLLATDGEGMVATLEVLAARGEVRVAVVSSRREPAPAPVVVGCGAPERDRADWMIEKLAELSVTDFQPLECERSGWERFAGRADRLRRLAVAALRQSRQAWLLRIREPVALSGWIDSIPAGGRRSVADPDGGSFAATDPEGGDYAAIGPSSGFSPAEKQLLAGGGFHPVRLASGRLRTETAAVVWAGCREALRNPPAASG